MSRKTSIAIAAACAAIFASGFLVGCNASCGLGTGGADAGKAASGVVEEAGDVISNVPGVGILGSLLKILGGAGVAYFGSRAVAKNEVKKYDEAPYDATDVQKIDQAKASAVVAAPKPTA